MKPINGDVTVNTINEDSGDSNPGMFIDDMDEQGSTTDEQPTKTLPQKTNLTTINTLVEQEISKTLHETGKRLVNPINTSPERTPVAANNNNTTNNTNPPPPPPPPLVVPNKSHSQYSSHPPQQFPSKGSIMRGTPISSSTPTNKPIGVEISSTHPHAHRYPSPRSDYAHLKSPKILDRNLEQQQQQQQQH